MPSKKKIQELRQQAIDKLVEQQSNRDIETAHIEADEALCALLRELGFDDVVEEYIAVNKWYA